MRPALTFTGVAITGTLIERGEHAMMAADGIYPDPAPGRVRPGHGKTHKACAALSRGAVCRSRSPRRGAAPRVRPRSCS
ncbi:hypothetical protein [Hyphomonas sp.]|jgi:hypothetical protein|uniref:hypothetical protein n=1 Tax=Hyphomonas sp. TaxID=87 RepID=UPI0037C06A60